MRVCCAFFCSEAGVDRMVKYLLIGNSIVADIPVENFTKIVLPGAKLSQMMEELNLRDTVKLVVSGILDIVAKGSNMVTGEWVNEYEHQLGIVGNMPDVVLCPFYPPRSLIPAQYGVVNRLNQRICELNAAKGEGTPMITARLFYWGEDGRMVFNSSQLRDEVHPGVELARRIAEKLRWFVSMRKDREDVRHRIDRRRAERGQQGDGPVRVRSFDGRQGGGQQGMERRRGERAREREREDDRGRDRNLGDRANE